MIRNLLLLSMKFFFNYIELNPIIELVAIFKEFYAHNKSTELYTLTL